MSSIVTSLQLQVGQFASQLNAIRAQIKQTKAEAASGQSITQAMVTGKGGKGGFANIGMASMQVQDIAVQLQNGTKAATVFAQQGSQLLSMFGPGGMLLGGAIAIGGAMWTAGENARQKLTEGRDAANLLHKELQAIATTGTLSDITAGMGKLAEHARSVAAAAPQQAGVGELFSDILSSLGVGPARSERFAENQRQQMMAAADRQQLNRAAVETAQQELQIVQLRMQGRNSEADEMERQLALAREISRIQQTAFAQPTKNQLIQSATATSEAGREMQLLKIRQQIEEKRREMAFDQLDTGEQINEVQQRMNDLLVEEDELRAAGRLDAFAVVDIERRRLDLQGQLNQLRARYNDEAQRSADLAKREAEDAARANDRRRAAVMSTMDEYNILKAKQTRTKRDDYQVEREIAIRNRRDQLMKENGLSSEEATKVATDMRDMEERANNGGRSPRIRRDRSGDRRMSGLDEFHAKQGQAWGVNALPESQFDKRQRTPFPWEKDLIPGKDRGIATTTANMAARNAPDDSTESITVLKDIAKTLRAVMFGN